MTQPSLSAATAAATQQPSAQLTNAAALLCKYKIFSLTVFKRLCSPLIDKTIEKRHSWRCYATLDKFKVVLGTIVVTTKCNRFESETGWPNAINMEKISNKKGQTISNFAVSGRSVIYCILKIKPKECTHNMNKHLHDDICILCDTPTNTIIIDEPEQHCGLPLKNVVFCDRMSVRRAWIVVIHLLFIYICLVDTFRFASTSFSFSFHVFYRFALRSMQRY